ncbi:MAG: lipid II flippase MurJ [Candidatus Paceibacterota bacterium]|jgi:putative peptidoglycan lipid II flippase
MEKILRIFNKEYGNINQAALLLGFFAFLSQILGLFRDRAIAHFIGPSLELDAYYAAFRIPDMIFISIASLVSITVLIPFLAEKMPNMQITASAKRFFSDIFTIFLTGIITVSIIVFILMPIIAPLITPGFTPFFQEKVIILSRIMLLSPIFLGLSNLFGSITQLFRRFFLYSLSPLSYNLGIICGVVFFYPIFGINGVAAGVVLGALTHFIIQVFSSIGFGFRPIISLKIDWKTIKDVIFISLPRTLGLSFNNIALILIIAFASYLKEGSISIFNLSFNLQSVPLGIIGLSYSVAAFPTLSRFFSTGKVKEFKEHLLSAGRQIVFWSLPVVFLFIVLRAQIVRVILGTSTFSWDNTRLIAASLAIFSFSIVAQGLIALFARAYYAGGNTRKPLYINLISSISIVIFSFVLIYLFKNCDFFRYFIESALKVSDIAGTEVLMLPLAYSLGTILNGILLQICIKKDFFNKEEFLKNTMFQSLGASFIIGFVTYLFLNIFSPIFGTNTFLGIFFQGLLAGVSGIVSGIIVLYLLKSKELKELSIALKTKFWKSKVIVPSQEEL